MIFFLFICFRLPFNFSYASSPKENNMKNLSWLARASYGLRAHQKLIQHKFGIIRYTDWLVGMSLFIALEWWILVDYGIYQSTSETKLWVCSVLNLNDCTIFLLKELINES